MEMLLIFMYEFLEHVDDVAYIPLSFSSVLGHSFLLKITVRCQMLLKRVCPLAFLFGIYQHLNLELTCDDRFGIQLNHFCARFHSLVQNTFSM